MLTLAVLIQSVLDVKDDTPLPRGSGIQPSFNRSILILTPARALKFTAVSQERHYLWLTALSFLAHSSVGAPELSAIPPVPQVEPEPAAVAPPTFSRRHPVRDSVRLTKDKQRPSALSSLTSSRDTSSRKGVPSLLSPTIHTEEPIPDAADAPTIPRYNYNSHGRKRSMTGPRIPPAPSTLRNFSSPAVPPCANYSISSGPSHVWNQASVDSDPPSNNFGFVSGFGGLSQPASLYGNISGAPSGRTSEASARTPISSQFADPAGTMRMEAFVAPRRSNDTNSLMSSVMGGAPSKMRTGAPVGRARGNTQWSSSTGTDPRRSGMIYMDEFDSFDPFKGF